MILRGTQMTGDHALNLHQRSLVIVMHDHNPVGMDLPRMARGGVIAKVVNIGVDADIGASYQASAAQWQGWARRALLGLEEVLRDLESHADEARLALTAGEIEAAHSAGRRAILLGCEGGKLLEGELPLLRAFHRLGLRELQLTWAFTNQIAGEGGLTAFGREVVREMNTLGLIIDLTHLPRRAFDDVIGLTGQPVIVSHGAARGVTVDLDDEQIRAVAAAGGVIGIHFYSTYLAKVLPDGRRAPGFGLDEFVDQVDYLKALVGIDHIGLGVDFFPTHGAWLDFQRVQGANSIRWAIDDLSQMPLVTRALVTRGYGDGEVQKILGLNFLRVCRAVFGK